MNVIIHPDAESFLARCSHRLAAEEALHNEIFANACTIATGNHPFHPPFLFASVEDGGEVCGCALSPPPDYLSLTAMPQAAIGPLADTAADCCGTLPGVMGPGDAALAFAAAWTERRGGGWALRGRWRWYTASAVTVPAYAAEGSLRVAELDDLPLARDWGAQFAAETGATVDVPAFFERRIRSSSLYLWEHHGTTRAVVAVSGKTPRGVRLSGVFTPPEHRRNGYASAAVAAVTDLMLRSGWAFCTLSSDLAAATPGAIYQRIGYRPAGDVAIVALR